MSNIIDRLAKQLAAAVQHRLPASGDASSGARLQSRLAQSIANALGPPGNAPPGTAEEQVAGLARRLRSWIASLARNADQTGQQNDISGKILDAISAKDTPAQRKHQTESTAVDAAALAHALLTSLTAPSSAQPLVSSTPPTAASPDAPVQNTPNASQTVQNAPTPITAANAPDLLARMLVRAASVDARINGISAQGTQPSSSSGSSSTPSALATRFATAVAAIAAEMNGANSNGNSNGSSFGRQSGSWHNDTASSHTTSAQLGVPFTVGSSSAPSTPGAQAQSPTRPPIDADALVAQVVKSMLVRTSPSGTSEIRLRLSPDHLGEVSMKLTVSGSTISANIVAQNGDARAALLSNQHQLAQSLGEAGLTLAGFSVDVSGGDAGREQTKDHTSGFGRRYVVHEMGGVSDEADTAMAGSLGPHILPRSSLDLFNYLA